MNTNRKVINRRQVLCLQCPTPLDWSNLTRTMNYHFSVFLIGILALVGFAWIFDNRSIAKYESPFPVIVKLEKGVYSSN